MPLNSVSAAASTNNQASIVNQQDFMRILLTQLTAQNPLKPMDNTAFVAQLAQFTQLAQTQEQTASLKSLLAVQTATQTVALLGRTVNVVIGGNVATGQVVDISYVGDTPALTIQPAVGAGLSGIQLNQVFDVR